MTSVRELPLTTHEAPVTAPSLLFISSDKFKPFRVDVRVLFAQELVARGYHIDWILQSEVPCDHSYVTQWGGGDVWVGKTDNRTSRWSRLRKHVFAIANELRLIRILKTRRYDCILVKDKFIIPLISLFAGRRHGVPIFYWLSYPFPEESLILAREGKARYPVFYLLRGLFFRFLLYRIILPRSHHIFVQSEQMKRNIMEMGISAAKLTPVPMGVDIARIPYDEKTQERHVPHARRPTLLYLGTLIKVRRLDFLIRVLAVVRADIPDVRLVLVGDGDDPSDRTILTNEAERCGVANSVEFTGFLPMETAWQFVAESDVCLSPFYPTPILNSTSPTKLIEYMAMGKPVVANDHPEQRLIIANSGAGYCVPWDEAEFAAAAVKLLKNPAAAASMGARGRKYVENARDYRSIAKHVDHTFRTHLAFEAHAVAAWHR